jgi:hypothetical protein
MCLNAAGANLTKANIREADRCFPIASNARAYITPRALRDEIIGDRSNKHWFGVSRAGIRNADMESQLPDADFVPIVYGVFERSISFVGRLVLFQTLSDILAIDECSIQAAQVSHIQVWRVDVEDTMPARDVTEFRSVRKLKQALIIPTNGTNSRIVKDKFLAFQSTPHNA